MPKEKGKVYMHPNLSIKVNLSWNVKSKIMIRKIIPMPAKSELINGCYSKD